MPSVSSQEGNNLHNTFWPTQAAQGGVGNNLRTEFSRRTRYHIRFRLAGSYRVNDNLVGSQLAPPYF